jgi:hypothetical protein
MCSAIEPQLSVMLAVMLMHAEVSCQVPTALPPHGEAFEHAAPPFPGLEHPTSIEIETAATAKAHLLMVA